MPEGGIEQTSADVQAGGDAVAGVEPAGGATDTAGLDAFAALGASMRWQDRLMIKMMSNKVVLKIFSNPAVMKVMTWEMNAIMAITSLFKRK
jgi:hypothetical protein